MKNLKTKASSYFKEKIEQTKLLFKKIWEILSWPEMGVLPGQLAFFLMLSLVPIITLIGYAASYFGVSSNYIIELITDNFTSDVSSILVPIIEGKSMDISIIIMLVAMFYFAANGPASIIYTANEIHGIRQSSWIRRRIKAMIITIILVILYLFILIVPLLGEKIISAVDYFNIKTVITSILSIMQGPISWIIIFIFIKTIFVLAPNKKIPSRQINIGAIFTTVGWILATNLYGYYASHYIRYDLFYAGLSNIAILMLWIYLLSYILVIGLSLTTQVANDKKPKNGSIKEEK